MVLLDNNSFIVALEKFANGAKLSGSFTVTFKKFDGHNKPKPREGRPPLKEPDEYLCLIRAQYKSKKNINNSKTRRCSPYDEYIFAIYEK